MDVFLTGFNKKLLVAISLVIIIAMCLNTAEARSMEARSVEHLRRHHRRPEALTQTKDNTEATEPRRRHRHHSESMTKDTGPRRPKNPDLSPYKIATRKIFNKLKDTWSSFKEDRKVLNESRQYRDGMPNWLPKSLNFVEIHFFNYKSTRRNGNTIAARKFSYIMTKLYKSLKQYEEIFKLLADIPTISTDEVFNSYKLTRMEILNKTYRNLYSTIEDIKDAMISVKLPVPSYNPSRMNLAELKVEVDATQCLKNDYIAFRAYGNLLNNWYLELKCSKSRRDNKVCRAFKAKMEKKNAEREQKKATSTS